MKTKILFMLINMNVGGTEKALLNMISLLPSDTFEITILLLEKYGGFLNDIPADIRVEYIEGYEDMRKFIKEPPQRIALEHFKSARIGKAFNIGWRHLLSKISKERSAFYKYLLKDYIPMEGYDVAVAYAGPMEFISYFVAHKVKAKKKIQWIHFDPTRIGFNPRFATKVYKNFDKIFVVSSEGKMKMREILPEYESKMETLYNVMSSELIVQLAAKDKGFDDDFDGIRILTVGRLSKEKGQDLSIPVLARLRAQGYNVRWYCVGEGHARHEYEQLITRFGVAEDYILLGATLNPYPYMKECDVYVQSSRHEGYCITLAEAKCFNKPIVTTNFAGANEQILHEKTGLIVNFNEDEMFRALTRLLDSKELAKSISNIRHQAKNPSEELKEFYAILE